jgi:hypothetical protein
MERSRKAAKSVVEERAVALAEAIRGCIDGRFGSASVGAARFPGAGVGEGGYPLGLVFSDEIGQGALGFGNALRHGGDCNHILLESYSRREDVMIVDFRDALRVPFRSGPNH